MTRAANIERAAPGDAVLVTGASSGMGEDAALFLNELGYDVFATVRHETDGERLRDSVATPDRLRPVMLDVTRTEQFAVARAQIEATLAPGRGLTGIFSNAGVALFRGDLSCEGCPLETQQQAMDTNFFGAVRVTQTFLPLVRAERGTIVFNSALMAHTVMPFNAGYAASKTALGAYADALRREVRSQGVQVVLVEAAAITTGLGSKQDPSMVPAGGRYPAQRPLVETFLGMQEREADSPRCAPRRVSEIVARAIQSPAPKTRYRVGGGHVPVTLLGRLPDKVQDRVFAVALAALARRATPSSPSSPS